MSRRLATQIVPPFAYTFHRNTASTAYWFDFFNFSKSRFEVQVRDQNRYSSGEEADIIFKFFSVFRAGNIISIFRNGSAEKDRAQSK